MINLKEQIALADYGLQRSQLFYAPSSLQWFVRKHKLELIAEEALLLVAGRWTVNPEKFDQVVVRAAHAAAQRRAGVSPDAAQPALPAMEIPAHPASAAARAAKEPAQR